MFGPLAAAAWLSLATQTVHLSGEITARNQARAGVLQTRSGTASSTLTISEFIMPSALGRVAFGQNQEITLRYRPMVYNTYRNAIPPTPLTHGHWRGFTSLHRGVLTYKAGEEHALEFLGTANVSAGKYDLGYFATADENLDGGGPDTNNQDAVTSNFGFLPGAFGQTINYLNASAVLQFKKRFNRSFRLLSVETLGVIQYSISGSSSFFANTPAIGNVVSEGTQSQLRLIAHQELEYIHSPKTSFFAALDYSDVSYQATASFPGVQPMLGYGFRGAGPTLLKVRAGALRYWTNPFPGVFEKPRSFLVADVALSHKFTELGLARLQLYALAGILPYYNLLFSSLEPRATFMMQLSYDVTRSLQANAALRLLSSRYWNFGHFNRLQHGHMRNYIVGSVGMRYHIRRLFAVDLTAYATEQTYEASSTQGYSVLRQFYAMLGLQGTWERR